MPIAIQIPRQAADGFVSETKQLATQAALRLLRQVAEGELTHEQATETLVEAVEGAIDATATLIDVAVALPSPAEELSDIAVAQGAAALKGIAAKPIAKMVGALDDAIGYNPRRAARRLANLLESDLEDGIVGDDHVRRVRRIALRIANRSPALAAQLAIRFHNGNLLVDGEKWEHAPTSG